jgi:hypothetical protein
MVDLEVNMEILPYLLTFSLPLSIGTFLSGVIISIAPEIGPSPL